MGEYFHKVRNLDDKDGQALVEGICNIFGYLHCLPVIMTPSLKAKDKVWTTSQDGIHLLTNPIFYKFKAIGSVPRTLTGSGVG